MDQDYNREVRWCEMVQFRIYVKPIGFCGGLNERNKQVKDDSKDIGLSNWKNGAVNELR